MTPEERKTRWLELQHEVRPHEEERIRIQLELMALTVDIAMDQVREAFPEITVSEVVFDRIENGKPPADIIVKFKNSGKTPKMAIVDPARMLINFVL